MWHLEFLEVPQDLTKSIQFNLVVVDQITKKLDSLIFCCDSPDANPMP
jgi:hypothetical protein